MRTKPFSELRKRMTPERRAQIETRVQLALLHLTLVELQQSLGVIQDNIGVVQSTLSKLENQEDIQLSTLSCYINALGGSLKLVAHFPDEDIILAQFE